LAGDSGAGGGTRPLAADALDEAVGELQPVRARKAAARVLSPGKSARVRVDDVSDASA
jgi:hypothetical protein